MKISPIKFKESYLEQGTTEEILSGFRFLKSDIEISPSRSDLMKNKVKGSIAALCFLIYINSGLVPMISLEIFPSAPTKLMSH